MLVSDIGMPGEDGYALIKKVRALSPETGGRIPAAALTAYARKEDRARALAAGFHVHLAKPISSDQLLATVAHLAAISNDLKSDQVKEATEAGAQGYQRS